MLIHRNSTIPVTKEDLFYTLFPGQDTVRVRVYQGENTVASRNSLLGEFLITDLTSPSTQDPAEVLVRFDFDVDGIVHVTAEDRYTGHSEEITVQAALNRMDEASVMAAQQQLAATAVIPMTDTARALLEQAQRLLNRDDLSAEIRTDLEHLLNDIQASQMAGNNSRTDELLETLVDRLFDLE